LASTKEQGEKTFQDLPAQKRLAGISATTCINQYAMQVEAKLLTNHKD
jgi:hypothetical protein